MERSKQLYVGKVFAILSVICAHMTLTIDKGQTGWLADKIIAVYGTIGVAFFFLCAGYYYHREKGDSVVFWKKKLKGIILPWIICSVLTYILNVILSSQAYSIIGQIKWTMGYMTWYYFVPVLLFSFMWFSSLNNIYWLYITILISIVSNILTIAKIWWVTDWCTPYTNPFNWLIFFALGIMWRKKEKYLKKIVSKSSLVVISSVVFVDIYVLWIFYNVEISYWNFFSLFFEILGCIVILYLAWYLRKISCLQRLGKNTFFIYLIHMQIAGIINTRLPQNPFFYLFKPLIVLAFMWGLVEVIIAVATLCNLKKILWIIGVRTE